MALLFWVAMLPVLLQFILSQTAVALAVVSLGYLTAAEYLASVGVEV
jgi:hypothetical protein